MALYLYQCARCELELEEMHPLGKAPERSIRCPLCGGWFERVIGTVNLLPNNPASRIPTANPGSVGQPAVLHRHGVDCRCCPPRRRQNSFFRKG